MDNVAAAKIWFRKYKNIKKGKSITYSFFVSNAFLCHLQTAFDKNLFEIEEYKPYKRLQNKTEFSRKITKKGKARKNLRLVTCWS